MEKKNQNSINWKTVIDWIVTLLAPAIPFILAKLFDSKDNDILLKVTFVSLVTSFLTTFVWIKFFSNKRDDKLVNRLIKEIETKKDLEVEIRELKGKIEVDKYFYSLCEERAKTAEKEKEKLTNEKGQLEEILTWHRNFLWREFIDENISRFDWVKEPEIIEFEQKIKREIEIPKKEVSNLRGQLSFHDINRRENLNGYVFCGINRDYHLVTDETKRENSIWDIKICWERLAGENGNNKINKKTIDKVLPINWEDDINRKEGEDIFKRRDELKKMIEEEKSKEKK